MYIKDKHKFKIEIKNKINKYVREFPIYFYGNILINIIFIVIMVGCIFFAGFSIRYNIEGAGYAVIAVVVLIPIIQVTLEGFFRNIKILRKIEAGDYDFGIENHEMDNTIEFIEDLPMKKEEIERLRISLSYNKLVDVLETAKIIECEGKTYDVNLVFKYKVGDLIENFYETNQ